LAEPGRILVSGGTGTTAGDLASVEILSATGVSQYVAPLNNARSGHTCTLMLDGRVLVTGGSFRGTNAEVYDPVADLWLPIASAGPGRAGSTATLLRDGRVLIAGGYTEDGSLLPYVEVFDPSSDRFTASRGQMNQPRRDHAAAALADGRVAITGGTGIDGQALRSTELFDPVTSVIWTGPDLITARRGHALASLADGRLLAAGGGVNLVETLDPFGQRWTTLSARLNGNGAGVTTALPVTGTNDILFAGATSAELFIHATATFRAIPGTEAWPGAALANGLLGDVIVVGGSSSETGPQDLVQKMGFPAITFDAPVYYPRQLVRVSGRNLPPNVSFPLSLQFVRGTASNANISDTPQFRNLAQRVSTSGAGEFGPTLLLETLVPDTGARLRLTANITGGGTVVRESAIKYPGELTFGIPASTVEGQNISLQVYVKPIDATPKPTGTITTTFGPLTMIENLNEVTSASTFPSAKLPPGALRVTAVYPGDAYYDFAILRTTLGVASKTPSVDIITSTMSPEIGVPFQIYAQVRVDSASEVTGGPKLTGTVTLYESGVPLGEAKLLWSTAYPIPQMLLSRDFTAMNFAPPLRFSATYAGDANYNPSSSGVISPVVQRAQPTLVVSAVPSIFNLIPAVGPPVRFHCDVPLPVYVGFAYPGALTLGSTAFTLAATTVTGSTVPLGGGNLEVVRPGNATALSVVTVPNDAIRITAHFPGDGLLRPASSAWLPVAIIPVPVQVRMTATPVDPATDALVLSATVINDAGRGCQIASPQGEVEFFIGTLSLGRVSVNSATGVANLRILRPLVTGPQTLFVRYHGDPLHTPTDSPALTITFNPEE